MASAWPEPPSVKPADNTAVCAMEWRRLCSILLDFTSILSTKKEVLCEISGHH